MSLLVAPSLLAAALAATPVEADPFETPVGFEPRVQLWAEVFGLYDENTVIVYDEREPGRVYAVVRRRTGEPLPVGLLGDRNVHFLPSPGAARAEVAARYNALSRLDLRRARLDDVDRRLLEPHGGLSAAAQDLRAAAESVRAQVGGKNRFAGALVRIGPYRAAIEESLISEGAPPDLISIPLIETMFDPGAVSRCGAAGAWQFMPQAAKGRLRMSGPVDERRDVYLATQAAARHLLSDYRALSTWPLAVTAYNTGRARALRATRAARTANIVSVVGQPDGVRGFGHASRNYFAEFLAARALLAAQDPGSSAASAVPFDLTTVVLPRDVDGASLRESCGFDADVLIFLNPAIAPQAFQEGLVLPAGTALYVPSPDSDRAAECVARPAAQPGETVVFGPIPVRHRAAAP